MTVGRRYLIGAVLFIVAYWYLTPTDQRLAKDFTLPIAGKADEQLTLASYQGQPVVLNFWATWCTKCRQEKEILANLQQQVTVISILTADPTPDQRALQGRDVVIDRDGRVARLYGIRYLPQTFLINAEQRIVEHWPKPLTDRGLSKIIGLLPKQDFEPVFLGDGRW